MSGNKSAGIKSGSKDHVHPEYEKRTEPGLGEDVQLYSYSFNTVFTQEHHYATERRRKLKLRLPDPYGQDALPAEKSPQDISIRSSLDRREDIPVTGLAGLALSGGGIRSAAFCMGVTQALDAIVVGPKTARSNRKTDDDPSIFQHMDYVSTVSGGGYLGSTLTAGLSIPDAAFPLPSRLTKDEPPVLQHIRDHSNYLFPKGGIWEKAKVLASYLRGIAANLPIIVCLMALALFATRCSNEQLVKLNDASFIIWELQNLPKDFPILGGVKENEGFFALSIFLAASLVVLLLAWALLRSIRQRPDRELKTGGTFLMAALMLGLFGLLFLELQPRMISGLHAQYCEREEVQFPSNEGAGAKKLTIDLFLAASCDDLKIMRAEKKKEYGAVISSLSLQAHEGKPCEEGECATAKVTLEETETTAEGGNATTFQAIVSSVQQLTVVVAGITGLYAALSGFFGSGEAPTNQSSGIRGVLRSYASLVGQFIAGMLLPLAIWIAYLNLAFWIIAGEGVGGEGQFAHAPEWFRTLFPDTWLADRKTMLLLLLGVAGASFVLTLFIRTNQNSPHNLYRDSLAKAFIVRQEGKDSVDARTPVNNLKLSEVEPQAGEQTAPIHLLNAALNIQGSEVVNGRGRNAGFFTFSPVYSGSFETGYVKTSDLEKAEDNEFTLSSAMAISAAAASSAMGSMTMKGLSATFALLNVRMGYWLHNPRNIAKLVHDRGAGALSANRLASRAQSSGFFLFFRELFGFMEEDKPLIYLSDGGHIENLGLYELLKRRCEAIIVVDGEADPNLEFGSFVTAQRYARIDLGTRIELSFDKITAANKSAKRELHPQFFKGATANATGEDLPFEDRPHVAIGRILYPQTLSGEKAKTGLLIYIKLSITGDENDYVRSYARRYRAFPHETTGDQFFSEEQFEAYRALGFHAAFNALTGKDKVQCADRLLYLRRPPKSGEKGARSRKNSEELPEALAKYLDVFPSIDTR